MKGYPTICKQHDRQEEAEDWAADIEREIKQGRFNVNLYKSQHTFTELLERYRNDEELEHIRSVDDVIRHLEYWKYLSSDPHSTQTGLKTHNRAGFRRHTSEGTEFYIFSETFKKDICKGREEKFVKQILYNHKLLKKDAQGKFTCSAKPTSLPKSMRFYVLIMNEEEEGGGKSPDLFLKVCRV